jgi:hypothetical protein
MVATLKGAASARRFDLMKLGLIDRVLHRDRRLGCSNRSTARIVRASPLVAGILCTLIAASAHADRLRCSLNPGKFIYYIAPVVNIEVNDFGRVRVADSIIESTDAEFVFGQVATESASKLSIRWDVRNVKTDPKQEQFRDATLLVRLSIQKASGSATMTVLDAHRRGAEYRAEGRCQQVD